MELYYPYLILCSFKISLSLIKYGLHINVCFISFTISGQFGFIPDIFAFNGYF